ncbi:MAG TPA: toll/interleukin-1 receptor domain-containing protein [Blastocatellia bacterium]|nr:toll/interleukin-1 receptor domain-containing protein [Blastocatellia bacterium]
MANKDHFRMLKQGVKAWNQWREDNAIIIPDLSGINIAVTERRAELGYKHHSSSTMIVLKGINLQGAILKGATLSSAFLSQANLIDADLTDANLRYITLDEANLTGAKLFDANLYRADLQKAILVSAYLSNTNLSLADLRDANLEKANLDGSDLSRAMLDNGSLRNAYLRGAMLIRSSLSNVDFSGVTIGGTVFADVDLSMVKALDAVTHERPSTIGIDTISNSNGRIPDSFLKGAGVPDSLIAYARLLPEHAIHFHSCFISYSSKNQAFAERIYTDLHAKGVRCWFAPEDLRIGERISVGIDESIGKHDKLLLVLSKYSVASDWVEQEVDTALVRERKEKRTILFPIRLDDAVMKIEAGWPAHIKNTRNIGDFRRWKVADAYHKALDRLVRDLKTEEPVVFNE